MILKNKSKVKKSQKKCLKIPKQFRAPKHLQHQKKQKQRVIESQRGQKQRKPQQKSGFKKFWTQPGSINFN